MHKLGSPNILEKMVKIRKNHTVSLLGKRHLLTNMVWPSQKWDMTCFLCHSFPSSFNTGHDIIWSTRRVFHEKQRTLTLPVHLVHTPSFWWSPGRSFIFSFLCVLFFVVCICVACCECLVSRFCLSFLDFWLCLTLEFWSPYLLTALPKNHANHEKGD